MTKPAAASVVTTALLFLLPLGAFGQVNFDIRLTGGMTPNEGRVEVYYSSQWRTICHDAWDIYDAHVVCRQLGYRGAIRHHTSSYFRGVSSNIFTSHVYCTGTESYIYECSRGYGVTSFPYYCSSNTNAGVTCSPERITDDGAVRLASGTTANQGRIEILLQGQWTTICQHGTTETTAQTVCKQLGYSDYDGYQTGAHHGQGRGLISMRNVNCGGYEPDVVSCRRSYYGLFADHGCQHNHDIGASCANNGDVRLSDGSSSSGRVEVFTRGQWQAVSTNSWDIFDAHVVCRQLGFRGARRTYHISNMLLDGSGSGTVMRVLNNLDCSGTESSLLNCTHNRLRAPDFTRARDAAAQCYYQESNGAVRLVDGPTANEGRVEVFFGRRWHTVCDSNWDLNDAHSVCRYMGYSGASAARGQAYYGEGTGEIILEDVGCTGSSGSPVSCRHNGLFVTSCTHKQDAGVECHHNGDIRLVPTTNDSAVHIGSIEVFYITQWYPVSGQGWNLLAAQVVCRQLGYSGAKSAGNGRVWYGRAWSFSRCRGLESNLFSCRRRSSVSTRHQLAECTCTKEQYISAGALRLVNGHTFSKGQVEVWLNGQWNFICDDYWGRKEAAVVCKEIGYTAGALSAHKGAKFGHGRGTLLLDDVECGRHDSSLLLCSHVGLYPRSCNKYKTAGVTCSDDRNGDVRLAGGRGPHIGRVEVYSEGEWYTICDNLWDIADAHVVCTQLGYKGAVAAHKGAHFGQGSGSILKDHVDCSGQESSLLECPSRAGSLCTGCTHANDAGVTCAEGNNNFGFRVRLVDGSTANQGRVELWMGGRWHSVCDDLWDLNDGSVVCRSLGYSGASAVSDSANYGEGKGDIILDNVNCTGNETHIAHCEHNGLLQEDCGHSEDAGVVCQQEGDVRLADGLTRREGRVEIYLKGQWTSVCGATWDARDASIVCRQLGYRGYASISRRSQFGQGTSILHDTVNCEGEERGLVECLQEAEATKDCNNRREAGVVCHTSKYTTGDLRLVNGSNSKQGLVEMFFKGHWSGLCGTTWNSVIAHVICKDLGYSSAKSYRTESTRVYTPANTIKISQLSCSSDHNMLSSCSHSGLIPRGGCSGHNFVYIVCA